VPQSTCKTLRSGPLVTLAAFASTAAAARTVSIPFNSSNFSNPLRIDNRYFPLLPGMAWTYEATAPDGCEVDRMQVTSDTRLLDGVTTRAVHDAVYDGDTCADAARIEDTIDYYAQDDSGNVWYMGERSLNCDGSKCTLDEGSWLAGEDIFHVGQAARPGIIMLAQFRSGDSYRQEFYAGHAEDEATVTALSVRTKLRRADAYRRSFSDCIVTKEFSQLEKGSIEFKSYCPNVGNVLTIEHHGKAVRSELTQFTGPSDALRFRSVRTH